MNPIYVTLMSDAELIVRHNTTLQEIADYISEKYMKQPLNKILEAKIEYELNHIKKQYESLGMKMELSADLISGSYSRNVSTEPKYEPYVAPVRKYKKKKPIPKRLQPKDWESTMTQDEIDFCYNEIWKEVKRIDAGHCVDNYRAARMWVSSQRRRFRRDRDEGCCGSHDFVAIRKIGNREDVYLLGFNYGH